MRRKRLAPKPEPPPPGKMYFGMELIDAEELREVCQFTLLENDEVPSWRNDPTYNLRKSKCSGSKK